MSHGFSRIFTDFALSSGRYSVVMDTSACVLKHSEPTDKIIRVYYELKIQIPRIHLPRATAVALEASGLAFAVEVSVPMWFRGKKNGQYYADLMGERDRFARTEGYTDSQEAHEMQLLHYLRATEIDVGLLLNFGLRPQFPHMLFDNARKKIRENLCESVAKAFA